ncbi:Vitamin B12 import system permease protein BtuC [Nocardia sp. RB56]|uniref:Vitamin B12 import system permease protein BtuC n=2 Tax=Nocardia aurantia TaxID=2585199 RepID=A0A7K0DQ50_9NOCA|nr:Vitamin B12 import system permease protein BtuC [Nocardia aurantia]
MPADRVADPAGGSIGSVTRAADPIDLPADRPSEPPADSSASRTLPAFEAAAAAAVEATEIVASATGLTITRPEPDQATPTPDPATAAPDLVDSAPGHGVRAPIATDRGAAAIPDGGDPAPNHRNAITASSASPHLMPNPAAAGPLSPRPARRGTGRLSGGPVVLGILAAEERNGGGTGPGGGSPSPEPALSSPGSVSAEPALSTDNPVSTATVTGMFSDEPVLGGGTRAAGHAPPASPVTAGPASGRRWSRVAIAFAVAVVALVALALFSAAVGQVPTTPLEVAGSVAHRIGLDWGPMPHHPAGDVTLWQVRFPRVVLAIVVGAALATAGALLQGVFANPLAEPGVIGVSSGAAVGAGIVIVTGGAFAAAWSVAAGAFVAGLGTTLLVYLLSRSGGRTETVTLVLTGVAVNAFAGGLMAFLMFTASPAARDQIVFWQLGSLNGATWQSVTVVAPLAAAGIAAALLLAPRLDLLALGESAARHLGVNVERLRRNVIVVVAVLATAGVSFTGVILFVGLIVPHLVRMLVGPAHRVLIPLSALVGAIVLLAADVGARTLVANADLPLGMLTSLVGGPFFFWLLRRTRARSGGWA